MQLGTVYDPPRYGYICNFYTSIGGNATHVRTFPETIANTSFRNHTHLEWSEFQPAWVKVQELPFVRNTPAVAETMTPDLSNALNRAQDRLGKRCSSCAFTTRLTREGFQCGWTAHLRGARTRPASPGSSQGPSVSPGGPRAYLTGWLPREFRRSSRVCRLTT